MTLDQKRALLEAAKRGDEAAWRAIVNEVGPKLRGYGRAKGVSDADDLMQDVLLAASRSIRGFEGTWENFISWLFTIAYRRIADVHRRHSRSPSFVPMESATAVADERHGPETLVVAQQDLSESLAALDSLSNIEREVVLLRIVAELDSDEVGRILGKRPGTVRVIQSRAISKIKRILQDEPPAVKKPVTNASAQRLRG